jgi:hypothetical protein
LPDYISNRDPCCLKGFTKGLEGSVPAYLKGLTNVVVAAGMADGKAAV